MSFLQNSGLFSTNGSVLPQPATFATMSTLPRLASAAWRNASIDAASVMSTWK